MAWTDRKDRTTVDQYPSDWADRRRAVITRAQRQCEHTQPNLNDENFIERCPYMGTDVDHIINIRSGGSHNLDNLQLLCTWHHKQKTAREARAGRTPLTTRRPAEKHPGIIDNP